MTAGTHALPLGLRLICGAIASEATDTTDDMVARALRAADEILEKVARKDNSVTAMRIVSKAAEAAPDIPDVTDPEDDDTAFREGVIAEESFRIGVAVAWRFLTAMNGVRYEGANAPDDVPVRSGGGEHRRRPLTECADAAPGCGWPRFSRSDH